MAHQQDGFGLLAPNIATISLALVRKSR